MDLINGKALTFLRRALPEDLAPINQVEVALSMGDSFVATGLTIEDNLLSRAAKATKGYAYLVQLVGYSIWQRANLHRAKSAIVSERDVTEGVALAEARFHDVVHEPAISGLGPNDIKYLLAMCEDKQQSKSAEIARRMGKKTNEISSIRAKLLQREVIQAPQGGLRAVCRARPRYLSARECRGDSRTVLNRDRATSYSLRPFLTSIAISGFSGATFPVIIRCGIHRRPLIRFRLSIALRV